MCALNDLVVVPSAGSTIWVVISSVFIVMSLSVLPFSLWLLKSPLVLRTDLVAGATLAVGDGLAATKHAIATT